MLWSGERMAGMQYARSFQVSFNIDYLKEIVARFAEGKLEFQINDGAHPCVFVSPEDGGFLCLLMPVRS